MSTPTLSALAATEWRHAPRRAVVLGAVAGPIMIALTHLVLPLFPERVIDFMRRGFVLADLAGVLVLNDLMAVYFLAFFIGLAGSLGVVLMAREEHRLEILLAKPIRPGDFVAARCVPALAGALLVGVATAVACGLAVAVHPEIGDSVSPAGTLGAGLFLTALALVLVAGLQLLFVRMRDPFLGLLVACFVWLLTSIPSAVLLYRPDVYQGRAGLADAIVMSSLLWHDTTTTWLGPLALVFALPLAWFLVRAAGIVLARHDAM
ncbi:hypothetical protein OV203_38635 [Nannocystis sp. ILAH1]|uniref:hypothetical protein n=1 Tax=Nannocystis sp. ILAH1 TaxID=2996789 RepID=UPI00226E78B9|nr:hypothetical protein [Nannocystis sp. ILAH1]MCY0993122.1 hypothetical protein [Nannocystis sp. ILAH1]